MESRSAFSSMTTLVFLLALLTAAASAERRRGWRNLKPISRSLECRQEFHDLQSKLLQALVVVRVRWSPGDELPASVASTSSRQFNISVTIQTVLKQLMGGRRLTTGSRITVGKFSGVLARRQRTRQKAQCTPSRLAEGRRGYVFFLQPTQDPAYFEHTFLPIKYSPGVLAKFKRVSCATSSNCPKAPRLMKAIPRGLKPNDETREISMRFVCRAHGEPLPVVRWLKDGVEVIYSDRLKAQVKQRAQSIVSRLHVKPVKASDAGNYTCKFANVVGSVNASFEIAAAAILNAERRFPSKISVTKMTSNVLLCDAANLTMCLNGGTCIRDRVDGRSRCLCTSTYSGHICEKHNGLLDFDYRA